MSLTRRDFLAAIGATAALCGVAGVGVLTRSEDVPVRPPGAQDEDGFLSACIRCDRCRSICPESSIGVGHIEDGIFAARLPAMVFHDGRCTFCNLCVGVCPTEALHSIDPGQDKLGVAVITSNCLTWDDPGSCAVCRDVCPYGAVTIVGGMPVVDRSICNGCGECVHLCPALVYRSVSGDRSMRGVEVYPESVAQRKVDDGEVR